MSNVLIYCDELANAEYTPSHPFKPVRARLFMELLNRYFHLHDDHFKIKRPEPLDEELLCLFHDRAYIELLKRAGRGEFEMEMLNAGLGTSDNPVFKGMFDLALTVAGGTYEGAMLLLGREAEMVFNPVGGLHHAGRAHASGFCYVNDIAVAITSLVEKGQRVAYIDMDAHHGDGVQEAFYATDRVLTISLHESGKTLFPGTGFETEIGIGEGRGYNVNLPFRAGTDDEVYLYGFEEIVPPLLEWFRADMVFAQIGGDCHRDDHFAHLNLTSKGYKRVVSRIRESSERIMAMGGGGYNIYKTAALWAIAWSALVGTEPEDKFSGLIGGMMYGPEADAGNLEDAPFVLEGREKELCFEDAERVVTYLKKTVFPIHGI
ncbi:MAG: Acetoin utilization protein AcuC [Syntrophorhabdaceae bacterium PtaU1.Bin034]|nr:MAG: Acetoin utilization protein AcuC [Syntrophorhabdaceae bacterium PtaU1.Bin034]